MGGICRRETIVLSFNTSVDPHEEPKRRPDLSYREVYFFARIPYKKLRFGGSPRQEFPIRNYGSWNSPAGARDSPVERPAIHVNGIRSEPGNTRLSKDDGSIQGKLPQTSDTKLLLLLLII